MRQNIMRVGVHLRIYSKAWTSLPLSTYYQFIAWTENNEHRCFYIYIYIFRVHGSRRDLGQCVRPGFPESEYLLFSRKVLVRRATLAKVPKIDKPTYT